MYKLKLIFVIAVILYGCFSGCSSEKSTISTNVEGIRYKVLEDTLGDSNLSATIYYESGTFSGDKTKTYYWKDKKIGLSKDKYLPTYANTYPSSSLNKLKDKLNLSISPIDKFGQLYFYGNCQLYELFVFEGSAIKDHQWRIYFLKDSILKEIIIKKEAPEVLLDSYQIANDCLYLYTRESNDIDSDFIVYKIDTNSYEVTKNVIMLNLFKIPKMVVQLDKIFISNDNLVMSSEGIKKISGKGSVVLTYNLQTKKANTIFIDHIVHKIFPYENGYLSLSSNIDDKGKIYLEKYNKEFNLISSSLVSVKSKHGNPIIGPRDYFYYIDNNRLYGSLSIDGLRNMDYLIAIDIQSSKVLFYAEMYIKDPDLAKQDVRFNINEKDKYINLNSF